MNDEITQHSQEPVEPWKKTRTEMMGEVSGLGASGALAGMALLHSVTPLGVAGLITGGVIVALAKETPEFYNWWGAHDPIKPATHALGRRLRAYVRSHQPKDVALTAVRPGEGGQEEADVLPLEPEDLTPQQQDTTLGLPPRCVFSQILANGWRPSLDEIFLGFLPGGQPIFVQAKDLCHIAICGPTGNGKSSLVRLIEAQLCYAGADVLHMDPDWTGYDIEQDEDWTPFIPKYVYNPFECKKYDVIEFFLKQIALEKIPHRRNLRAQSKPTGKKYFVSMDELPAIMDAIPEAQEYLKTILRDGRKHGIYLISSSQDFLVSTMFPKGGGEVRECYRTAFCIGGNNASSRTLLDVTAKEMPEDQLGQGVVMIRCKATQQARLVRVPYLDNESLYILLGPSTYVPSESKYPTDVLGLPPGHERAQTQYTERAHQREREYQRPHTRVRSGRKFTPRAESGKPPVEAKRSDMERGIEAYRNGAKTLDNFMAVLDMKPYPARVLWAKVKVALEEK